MWYTDNETDTPGVDSYDPNLFEAKEVQDGRYVIVSHEGIEPVPIGLPVDFDTAVAIIRWIRDGGLRDYRRAIIDGYQPDGVYVKRVRDLSVVPTDADRMRGQLSIEHGDESGGFGRLDLGADLPTEHAMAIATWLRVEAAYGAA